MHEPERIWFSPFIDHLVLGQAWSLDLLRERATLIIVYDESGMSSGTFDEGEFFPDF